MLQCLAYYNLTRWTYSVITATDGVMDRVMGGMGGGSQLVMECTTHSPSLIYSFSTVLVLCMSQFQDVSNKCYSDSDS